MTQYKTLIKMLKDFGIKYSTYSYITEENVKREWVTIEKNNLIPNTIDFYFENDEFCQIDSTED